jgi:hypothetical protein
MTLGCCPQMHVPLITNTGGIRASDQTQCSVHISHQQTQNGHRDEMRQRFPADCDSERQEAAFIRR